MLRAEAETPRGVRRAASAVLVSMAQRWDSHPATSPCFSTCAPCGPRIAREEGIAAFMVFPDRTLIEMAKLQPVDRHALRLVHGVGERKLSAYGDVFLEAIAEFLADVTATP